MESNCPDLPLFTGRDMGDLLTHASGNATRYYDCRSAYRGLAKVAK